MRRPYKYTNNNNLHLKKKHNFKFIPATKSGILPPDRSSNVQHYWAPYTSELVPQLPMNNQQQDQGL